MWKIVRTEISDQRKAFEDICKYMESVENKKDRFLKAANLQRHERADNPKKRQAIALCGIMLGIIVIVGLAFAYDSPLHGFGIAMMISFIGLIAIMMME
ncbi:MAG: hypothetical protein GX096_07930 [Clostridiales bacterium]|nr:hypothetical protein [Clostridiales bacterium]